MKMPKYEFQWFEREDRRKAFRASVSKEGKLRLGQSLRKALPPDIRVGFDARCKVLAIADGHGSGIVLPRGGVLTAQVLSAQLAAAGLGFPVPFQLVRDPRTGYFLGKIRPRRCCAAGTACGGYDGDQLLVLYRHVIDTAVGQLAKSTPLEERRAYALEAFYQAAGSYCPGYGDLESYLEEQVRKKLLTENRQYAAVFRERSLDQPLPDGEDSGFCLYDTLEASTDGGIHRLEERIMAEQFLDSLSQPEQRLWRMLKDGCSLAQIARRLGVTEGQLMDMGQAIRQKRRQFYDVA